MKVLLLGKNKINSFKLPNRVDGNVWITFFDEKENEKNIINVEAGKDGNWYLISNSEYFTIDNNNKVSSKKLEEGKFYIVKNQYSTDLILLYCAPTEEKMELYSITSDLPVGINIGSSSECKIQYGYSRVSAKHAQIISQNNEIFVRTADVTYVNDIRVNEQAKISFGDTIFIYGLKMVFIKNQNDYYLGINNPGSLKILLTKASINNDNSLEKYDEPNEEKEMELYSRDDYFYRKPRFIYSVTPLELSIDTPPGKKEETKMPAILTFGPMITMSFTSILTIYNNINNLQNNNAKLKDVLPSLIMGGAMILSMLFWPFLTNAFQKHLNRKEERERQKKYSEYIDKQKEKIIKEKTNQETILRNSYLDLNECANIILNKRDRLWERRIDDEDFFSASLGYGILPMKINIKYPEEHFSMTEDNLLDKVNELNKSPKILEKVPIPFSFRDNYISAIIGKDNLNYKIVKNILLQLVTFQSYDNLKIVILTSKNKEFNFEEFKILPHIFSNDKSIRFFATENDEYKEVMYYLEKVFNSRKEKELDLTKIKFEQNYLIVTDSFNSIRNYEFIENLVEDKLNYGFSLLILNNNISNLPDQCQTFIELTDDESKIFKNISNSEEQKFKIDLTNVDYFNCFKKLSNIPVEINDDNEGIIPKKVGFLEMYEVGKVEQLNCKSRWKKNVPILNMAAIIGVGKNGEKISLDLHEKYHGPHGLVAGMTGSGKSEFIITYILSMAINYHPDEVQFILIDYKGGGLAGAFENQNLGYKLPHLVGVITNLDKTEIHRSLSSIESELKRRQALFNKAREISGESTVDIYKYQNMYRNHTVDEPVSHLFIIADEFAELKTQQPEFMEQLISTARIGRSLGVHLILATQKPSGVVDSQIWSNTRFRVCFRVQERGDSSEVIQCPDAAYLTQTGRFYLQVGYNEIFLLGQSAWAGGKYIPSENIKKTIDSSVNFINNIGFVERSIETKKEETNVVNLGEELINIVKYLDASAKEENIKTRPLWLERIPNIIYITNLIKKYKYVKQNYVLNPVIGEYDVPNMQEQHLLTIPFYEDGNTLVYGMAGSGKENFITSMIYSSMITYTASEVNYYIIDCGAEVLRYFNDTPIVGDILYINDDEKIKNLFKMISDMIEERKKLFANYNGSYEQYIRQSGKGLPNIVVVLNNFEAFIETYQDYEETLIVLARDSVKYGIYFVLSVISPNGVRFKLKQNFGQIFCLQQNSDDEYTSVLGNVNKTYPSKLFGRGLIKKEEVYEFQTAFVSEIDNISSTIKNVNAQLNQTAKVKANKIPTLPDVVIYEDYKDKITGNNVLIGVDKITLAPSMYDFRKNNINIITGQDLSGIDRFIEPLISQFITKTDLINVVINADDTSINDLLKNKVNYYDNNYDGVFEALNKVVEDSDNLYKQHNYNKNIFTKRYNIIIFGMNSFLDKISDDTKKKIEDFFKKSNNPGIFNFIIVDSVDKIKGYEYESWFKEGNNKNDGIWIGSGIRDQFSINISIKTPELSLTDVPYNFCYVVKNGRPQYVKYVEKINNEE